MSTEALLPATLLATVSLLLGWHQPRLHPSWTARLLIALSATTAMTVFGTLGFVILIATAQPPPKGPAQAVLPGHGPIPLPAAVVAAIVMALMAAAIVRLGWHRQRDARHVRALGRGVVADDRPFALAVPGRSGGVVVSTALLGLLSGRELRVVFQHEAAHLRHRHHLYLAISSVAVRIFPPLAYTHRALRFALERWADEDAAEAVGDRALTARTIARVALAHPRPAPGGYPALTDSHVVRRVQALLEETPRDNSLAGPILLSGTWVATGGAVSSALQLHHAAVLLVLF
ncbi:M56 family metallopeptidase [Nonomuraea sp. NBC_00507]|uniref:M56 family metallopeptidase n=1 Tax=Nonomuraea sp. NBC_00507 TaxID=2976002 RepID=UPI002E182147